MRLQRILLLLLGPCSLLLVSWTLAGAQHQPTKHTVGALEPILDAPILTKSTKHLRYNAIVKAVQRVRKAVVNIHSERTVNGPDSADLFTLPSQNRVNGMGTGIIVDPRGYIVTNKHVVEDVSLIKVHLSDGTNVMANVVARDPEVDLALLKIDVGRQLQTIPLGTAEDLMEGEDVIAIGNAFGYEHTISRGIVSAIKRDVNLNKNVSYRSLIQTDASINPGNSGGPLINILGELVGINVAIRAGAQGIGFAIPVDTMIRSVSGMLGSIRRTAAGDGMIYHDDVKVTEEGSVRRVVVDRVLPDSPAAEAGIRQGDILQTVAGISILCSYDVDRALLGRSSGDDLQVKVLRKGELKTAKLTLERNVPGAAGASDLVWKKLGIQVAPVSKNMVAHINGQLNGGMRVTVVTPGGLAARSGIRQDDILVGLHQWETLSLDNISFVLLHPDLSNFNPLSFYIIRDGQVRRGWIQNLH